MVGTESDLFNRKKHDSLIIIMLRVTLHLPPALVVLVCDGLGKKMYNTLRLVSSHGAACASSLLRGEGDASGV